MYRAEWPAVLREQWGRAVRRCELVWFKYGEYVVYERTEQYAASTDTAESANPDWSAAFFEHERYDHQQQPNV